MKLTKSEVFRFIRGTCIAVAMFCIGGLIGFNQHNKIKKPMTDVVVAYTADPAVKNDGQFQLGYPGNRFSVTCSTKSKECLLETEINGKDEAVKMFPYVMQEWFTPKMSNRPYHTLDVIRSLPSYNGNTDLKFGTNIEQNRHMVNVLRENGWLDQ